jgi:hypothetical protein
MEVASKQPLWRRTLRGFYLRMVSSADLTPLSPLQPVTWEATIDTYGWRGEYRREGAPPPLIFSPPLEQILIRAHEINQFEREIKGVSINEEPDAKSTSLE